MHRTGALRPKGRQPNDGAPAQASLASPTRQASTDSIPLTAGRRSSSRRLLFSVIRAAVYTTGGACHVWTSLKLATSRRESERVRSGGRQFRRGLVRVGGERRLRRSVAESSA